MELIKKLDVETSFQTVRTMAYEGLAEVLFQPRASLPFDKSRRLAAGVSVRWIRWQSLQSCPSERSGALRRAILALRIDGR